MSRSFITSLRTIVAGSATLAALCLGVVPAGGQNLYLAGHDQATSFSDVETRNALGGELASWRAETIGAACAADVYGDYAGCPCVCCRWPTGFYIGLSGGPQSRSRDDEFSQGFATDFRTGFGVSGMLGYRFRNHLRTEFEASFLDNNSKSFIVFDNGVPIIEDPASGHVSMKSFMANLYYDVPVERWFPALWRFQPYVGGGIGTTEVRFNGYTSPLLSGMLGDQGFAPFVLDTSSKFTYSWQIRAGVSYLLTGRTEFFAGWRHLQTSDLRFNTVPSRVDLPAQQEFGELGVIDMTGAKVNMAEFGLRIYF